MQLTNSIFSYLLGNQVFGNVAYPSTYEDDINVRKLYFGSYYVRRCEKKLDTGVCGPHIGHHSSDQK